MAPSKSSPCSKKRPGSVPEESLEQEATESEQGNGCLRNMCIEHSLFVQCFPSETNRNGTSQKDEQPLREREPESDVGVEEKETPEGNQTRDWGSHWEDKMARVFLWQACFLTRREADRNPFL